MMLRVEGWYNYSPVISGSSYVLWLPLLFSVTGVSHKPDAAKEKMGVVEQLLVHWRSALFAAIPLIGLYLYRRFARPSNFLSRKRLAQLPQPDGWTEKDGHWSWVIASATAEGYDERRSFGT